VIKWGKNMKYRALQYTKDKFVKRFGSMLTIFCTEFLGIWVAQQSG